ncbi:MAG: methyltransferase domain-containing protein [Candidatus Omnitrophota bacterium]|nr:methyltransferase domain-containing protein [Candidatus Omnitrophota bacterium]
MKLSHISMLECMECGGALKLADNRISHASGDFIENGVLQCERCGESYPVIDGIGIFFKNSLLPHFLNDHEKIICDSINFIFKKTVGSLLDESLLTQKASNGLGYQRGVGVKWDKSEFEKDDFNGPSSFREFIRIEPEEYRGRKVVIWCGGTGREAYHVSKNSPGLVIVTEAGDEIYRVKELIDKNIDLLLVRCDILCNPLRSGIADISICDHALQHVIDKRGAFFALANVLVQGGTVAVCVYSYENNFIMTHVVEPLKGIIRQIPLGGRKFISIFPAIFIFLLIKLFYLPVNFLFPERICKKLPLFDHMMLWSKSNFKLIKSSCFSLIKYAPVSYHFSRDEVRKLAEQAGLSIDKLENTYGTTWSMTAKRTKMNLTAGSRQKNSEVFYDFAWQEWRDMVKHSPAPRMRRKKIVSWLSSVSPGSILDVGCGNAELLLDAHRLMPDARLVGADISDAVIASNRVNFPGMSFSKIDLNKEALGDKFDAVICMEVIEHCDDYRAAVKSLASMTGKWLFITVPCGPMFEIDRRVGHKKHFKPKEIEDALKNEGLDVIRLEAWGFPFFNLYKRMINLRPDKIRESFLSGKEYSFSQKILASATYAAFNLCLPKWGFQLFVMAGRK